MDREIKVLLNFMIRIIKKKASLDIFVTTALKGIKIRKRFLVKHADNLPRMILFNDDNFCLSHVPVPNTIIMDHFPASSIAW